MTHERRTGTNHEGAQRWREVYPVHPCADVFPMLSEAELDALAADIQANGLRQPIVLWTPDDRTPFVLDGRNRLDALARAGLAESESWFQRLDVNTVADPAAFVISANIRRRHLAKEEQAELIVKTIAAGTIDGATVARSFSPTPGQKGGSTKDPLLAAAVAEGEKHGISKRTIQRAGAKLAGRTPKSTIAPAVSLPPAPPSTYEWVDARLSQLRRQQDHILEALAELDATAPKLTPAERRTVRDRLLAVRRRVDRSIVHFGGTHKAAPDGAAVRATTERTEATHSQDPPSMSQ
jgi:hypothetical protein